MKMFTGLSVWREERGVKRNHFTFLMFRNDNRYNLLWTKTQHAINKPSEPYAGQLDFSLFQPPTPATWLQLWKPAYGALTVLKVREPP